jgi:hypothetical protein
VTKLLTCLYMTLECLCCCARLVWALTDVAGSTVSVRSSWEHQCFVQVKELWK